MEFLSKQLNAQVRQVFVSVKIYKDIASASNQLKLLILLQ